MGNYSEVFVGIDIAKSRHAVATARYVANDINGSSGFEYQSPSLASTPATM
jgi:hypothetical protein